MTRRLPESRRRYQKVPPMPEGYTRRTWRRQLYPIPFLISPVKARARAKGLEFNLKAEDLFLPSHCPVLGIPLSWDHRQSMPTVDRVDNSKGYIKGNVVVVSWRANWLKSDATPEELIKLSEYYGKAKRKPITKKNTTSPKEQIP